MKQTSILLLLLTLFVTGCSDKGSSKSSSTATTNPYCAQNPYAYGCQGTTGGVNPSQCTGQGYWINPGCPGFCQTNPSNSACYGGGTTGTTTGGYTGGNYGPMPDNDWASLYPGGIPTGSCSSPTGSGYDLRKGTVTIAGGMSYLPNNPWNSLGEAEYTSINYTHNNSDFLVSVNQAKAFFDSDSKLKVRFKVRPQPKPSVGKSWCFGRQTGQYADSYGYKSLKFAVSLRGVNADGSLGNFQGTQYVAAGVNSCTQTVDFSGYQQQHPNGVVVVVHGVQSDQGCWNGTNCTTFVDVRAASCWQLDFEVAVDGTKDI